MENKKFIKFAGLMIAIVAVIAAIVFFLLNATWTDRFGFTHNANNDASYSSDLNASRSYALVEMNSEILTYSDHKLIETLSPVLVAYSDKYYTTFMFEDGTGLYFPESKLTNGAFYGYVDETGNITQDILYYDFTATTVSTEEIRKSATAESREIYNYYPEDFKNDYSNTVVDNNCLYAVVAISEGANASMREEAARNFYAAFANNIDLTKFNKVYVMVNSINVFVIDPTSGDFTIDNSLLDFFAEL